MIGGVAVGGGDFVAHCVDVGVQLGEVGCSDDDVVGVHHPDVVAVALGEGQRFGPVGAEVAPRTFVELTGNAEAVHVGADQLLGAVV